VEYRVVDLWVGNFPSKSAFEDYLHETYGDDDSTPISKFAADMGANYYDHDFLEEAYHEEPPNDLGSLLEGHSFARSYAPQTLDAFRLLAPGTVNAVILLWGRQIESPRSVGGAGYELHYLGRFDSDPNA
jgi:hypothetical protein